MSSYTNGSGRNGSTTHMFGVSGSTREATDAQMEQVRELLFGEFKREMGDRLTALEVRMTAMEQRLAAAISGQDTHRRAVLDELSRGMTDLSDHIRRIGRP